MKDTLLTSRQMEVLRYRKSGMTQQEIADKLHTSKANICTIEKSARENIQRAKETLEFYYTLDATSLCTLAAGTDLMGTSKIIYAAATAKNIKIKYDTLALINRISTSVPEKIKSRLLKDEISVYITDDGDLYFA